jgi:hypothetical protein
MSKAEESGQSLAELREISPARSDTETVSQSGHAAESR